MTCILGRRERGRHHLLSGLCFYLSIHLFTYWRFPFADGLVGRFFRLTLIPSCHYHCCYSLMSFVFVITIIINDVVTFINSGYYHLIDIIIIIILSVDIGAIEDSLIDYYQHIRPHYHFYHYHRLIMTMGLKSWYFIDIKSNNVTFKRIMMIMVIMIVMMIAITVAVIIIKWY